MAVDQNLVSVKQVRDALGALAIDTDVVHKTNNLTETITGVKTFTATPQFPDKRNAVTDDPVHYATEYQQYLIKQVADSAMPKQGGQFTGNVTFNQDTIFKTNVTLGDSNADVITFNGVISELTLQQPRGRLLGTSDLVFATEKQVTDALATAALNLQNYVRLTGGVQETITGEKTFMVSPKVPAKSIRAGNNVTTVATEQQVFLIDEEVQGKLDKVGGTITGPLAVDGNVVLGASTASIVAINGQLDADPKLLNGKTSLGNDARVYATEAQVYGAIDAMRSDVLLKSQGGTISADLIVTGATILDSSVQLGNEATDIITFFGSITDPTLQNPKNGALNASQYQKFATEGQVVAALNGVSRGIIPYGTSSSLGATSVKDISLPASDAFNGEVLGQALVVTFSLDNTDLYPYLRINMIGQGLPIMMNGAPAGEKLLAGTYLLECNGSVWNVAGTDAAMMASAPNTVKGLMTFVQQPQMAAPKTNPISTLTPDYTHFATEGQVVDFVSNSAPVRNVLVKRPGEQQFTSVVDVNKDANVDLSGFEQISNRKALIDATASDNSYPTTRAVYTYVQSIATAAVHYKGTVDTELNLPVVDNKVGDYWNIRNYEGTGRSASAIWNGTTWDFDADTHSDVDGITIIRDPQNQSKLTVARFGHPITFKYSNGTQVPFDGSIDTELPILAMPVMQLVDPVDGSLLKYNASGQADWFNVSRIVTTDTVQDINAQKTFKVAPLVPSKMTAPQANGTAIATEYQVHQVGVTAEAAMPKAGGTFTGPVYFGDALIANGPVTLGDSTNDVIKFTGVITEPTLSAPKVRALQPVDTLFASEKQVVDAIAILQTEVKNSYVRLTGDIAESITGLKTFLTSPLVPGKSSAAENRPTEIATETQVFDVAERVDAKFDAAGGTITGDLTVNGSTILGLTSANGVTIRGALTADPKLAVGKTIDDITARTDIYATESQVKTVWDKLNSDALLKNVGGNVNADVNFYAQVKLLSDVQLGDDPSTDTVTFQAKISDPELAAEKSTDITQNYKSFATEGQVMDAITRAASGIIPYGISMSPASHPAREVTVEGPFRLSKGQQIVVYFREGSTTETSTLKVNNSTESTIYYQNNNAGPFAPGTYTLEYDGGIWNILGNDATVNIWGDQLIKGIKEFEEDIIAKDKDTALFERVGATDRYATEYQVTALALNYVKQTQGLNKLYGTSATGQPLLYEVETFIRNSGNENIGGVKTFITEPILGILSGQGKTSPATNDGTRFATEAQVFNSGIQSFAWNPSMNDRLEITMSNGSTKSVANVMSLNGPQAVKALKTFEVEPILSPAVTKLSAPVNDGTKFATEAQVWGWWNGAYTIPESFPFVTIGTAQEIIGTKTFINDIILRDGKTSTIDGSTTTRYATESQVYRALIGNSGAPRLGENGYLEKTVTPSRIYGTDANGDQYLYDSSELAYIRDVTLNTQSIFNAATHIAAFTSQDVIRGFSLEPGKLMISQTNGGITTSTIEAINVETLAGIRSNIQDQLDTKLTATSYGSKIYGTDENGAALLYSKVSSIGASSSDVEIATAAAVYNLFSTYMSEAIRYKGVVDNESLLPESSLNKNGDLWEVRELTISNPGHAGHVIWNADTVKFDVFTDDQREVDNVTLKINLADNKAYVAQTLYGLTLNGNVFNGSAALSMSVVEKPAVPPATDSVPIVSATTGATRLAELSSFIQSTGTQSIGGTKTFTEPFYGPAKTNVVDSTRQTEYATEAQVATSLATELLNYVRHERQANILYGTGADGNDYGYSKGEFVQIDGDPQFMNKLLTFKVEPELYATLAKISYLNPDLTGVKFATEAQLAYALTGGDAANLPSADTTGGYVTKNLTEVISGAKTFVQDLTLQTSKQDGISNTSSGNRYATERQVYEFGQRTFVKQSVELNKVYGTNALGDQVLYDYNALGKVDTVNGIVADTSTKNVQIDGQNINVDDAASTPETIADAVARLGTTADAKVADVTINSMSVVNENHEAIIRFTSVLLDMAKDGNDE